MGGVHQSGAVRRLSGAGGGDGPRQLPRRALRPQQAEFPQSRRARPEVLIAVKGGGVLLHVGRDEGGGFVNQGGEIRTLQKFREILVVLGRIRLVLKNPVHHRPAVRAAAGGNGGIDRRIDLSGGVPALEGAESQIIVPGNHGQQAVLLVQVVVVDHGAGVAVAVADEVVDHEVAQDLLHADGGGNLRPLVQNFQRLNQPGLVRLGHVRLGAAENVRVAVRVVVGILQLHVAAAHAAEAGGHFHTLRRTFAVLSGGGHL